MNSVSSIREQFEQLVRNHSSLHSITIPSRIAQIGNDDSDDWETYLNDPIFAAIHIPGSTDDIQRNEIIALIGESNANFIKVTRMFSQFGQINCIDVNSYYRQNGYAVIFYENLSDAVKAYDFCNHPGNTLMGIHVRCHYFLGDPDPDSENESIHSRDSSSSSPLWTYQNHSVGYGIRRATSQLLSHSASVGNLTTRVTTEAMAGSSSSTSRLVCDVERVRSESLRDNRTTIDQDIIPIICKICLTNKIKYAFNCGHVTCGDCSERLAKCHMCRIVIINKQKIYL